MARKNRRQTREHAPAVHMLSARRPMHIYSEPAQREVVGCNDEVGRVRLELPTGEKRGSAL